MDSTIEYEKVIYENEAKFYQLRLTLSHFRDTYYVNIRKYFLSYDGEYVPSKEGISMEASIGNIYSLLGGLLELVSDQEAQTALREYANTLKREDFALAKSADF